MAFIGRSGSPDPMLSVFNDQRFRGGLPGPSRRHFGDGKAATFIGCGRSQGQCFRSSLTKGVEAGCCARLAATSVAARLRPLLIAVGLMTTAFGLHWPKVTRRALEPASFNCKCSRELLSTSFGCFVSVMRPLFPFAGCTSNLPRRDS